MKAIAKHDIKYDWYDYTSFIVGNKYDCQENDKDYLTFITDEKSKIITFCGNRKHLINEFDFVEE